MFFQSNILLLALGGNSNQNEGRQIAALAMDALLGAPKYPLSEQAFNASGGLRDVVSKANIVRPTKPFSGGIVLSPYFNNSIPYSRYNLQHEMGHACLSIRKQLLLLRKNPQGTAVVED